MKNSQKIALIAIALIVLAIIVCSVCYYFFQLKDAEIVPTNNEQADAEAWKTYRNTEYGFELTLPDSWRGYTVVKDVWKGGRIDTSLQQEEYTGPKIILKNPQTTAQQMWQDIPIMIFTPEEWQLIADEKLAVSAAPIGPTALGYNSNYVFATPPRWYGFTDTQGWQEAVEIVKTFKVTKEDFSLSTSTVFTSEKLGVRFSYLSYDQQFNERFSIKEEGSKLFISFDSRPDMSPRSAFVTVLNKTANETLQKFVERVAFNGVVPQGCIISAPQHVALKDGYQALQIRSQLTLSEDREHTLCGQNEFVSDFISAYFIYNPQVPTKVVFVNNMQDPFPSAPRNYVTNKGILSDMTPSAAETIEIFK